MIINTKGYVKIEVTRVHKKYGYNEFMTEMLIRQMADSKTFFVSCDTYVDASP